MPPRLQGLLHPQRKQAERLSDATQRSPWKGKSDCHKWSHYPLPPGVPMLGLGVVIRTLEEQVYD